MGEMLSPPVLADGRGASFQFPCSHLRSVSVEKRRGDSGRVYGYHRALWCDGGGFAAGVALQRGWLCLGSPQSRTAATVQPA